MEFFCSSDSSLTECLEHCKNDFEKDLKLLHCLDDLDFQIIGINDLDFHIIGMNDFDFQIIDMNIFDFKSPKYGDFDFKIK